jgi:hypothetical protein
MKYRVRRRKAWLTAAPAMLAEMPADGRKLEKIDVC